MIYISLYRSYVCNQNHMISKVDKFLLEAADLGKVYKVKIRHDNSMINPSWFLDKIEVIDQEENDTSLFHCERWLSKNKDDGKIERSLYVKVYYPLFLWQIQHIFLKILHAHAD